MRGAVDTVPCAANGYRAVAAKNKTLKYNADGSLTLYAGATSPGKDKESDWLPAPSGAFSLRIRAYRADKDQLLFRRAVDAYMLTLPALNVIGMRDGSESKFGAGYHVLPVWKDRMNGKTLVTTAGH